MDNDRPFVEVQSKAARRMEKRKDRSAAENDIQAAKKVNDNVGGTVRSYASVTESSAITAPTSSSQADRGLRLPPAHRGKIVGRAACSSLKAASPVKRPFTEKAVFCVSNVRVGFSENDIRGHCRDMGVPVLFCFDISKANIPAKAFKLAVRLVDKGKVENCEAWPSQIIIRPWNYNESEERVSANETVADNSARMNGKHDSCLTVEAQNDDCQGAVGGATEVQAGGIVANLNNVLGNTDQHSENDPVDQEYSDAMDTHDKETARRFEKRKDRSPADNNNIHAAKKVNTGEVGDVGDTARSYADITESLLNVGLTTLNG
jgi:hypothetical protein